MVDELSPYEVARRLREAPERILLLDVREPFEREVAEITPSLHIPMQEVPSRLAEIPRDRTVVVYCHTGVRSALVAGFLAHQGFSHVVNLGGGIDAWSLEVDSRVARYG